MNSYQALRFKKQLTAGREKTATIAKAERQNNLIIVNKDEITDLGKVPAIKN